MKDHPRHNRHRCRREALSPNARALREQVDHEAQWLPLHGFRWKTSGDYHLHHHRYYALLQVEQIIHVGLSAHRMSKALFFAFTSRCK